MSKIRLPFHFVFFIGLQRNNVLSIDIWSDMMLSKRICFVSSKVLLQYNYLVLFIFGVVSIPIVFTTIIFYHSKALVLFFYNNVVSFDKITPFFLRQSSVVWVQNFINQSSSDLDILSSIQYS